jgi:hypothetical protein
MLNDYNQSLIIRLADHNIYNMKLFSANLNNLIIIIIYYNNTSTITMEINRVFACVQQLSQYLRHMTDIDDNIHNIMRIMVRYIEVRRRYGFNPITPIDMHFLNTYIESIRYEVPIDIIITLQSTVIVIQNDHTTQNDEPTQDDEPTQNDEPTQDDVNEEEAEKYENLRRGADRIRQKLTELESTPNTDPNNVSTLTKHLVNIMKYLKDFETKYGGGASKF